MINTIITDFDGTLVDTFEANFRAYQKAFADNGLIITEDQYRENFGFRFDRFMESMGVADSGLAEAIREAKKVCYPDYFQFVRPNRALIELMSGFKALGGKTAIASTARKENLINVIEYLGIADSFDLVFAGMDVREGKPSPEIYIRVMKELGSVPEETLIFEDSDAGIQSARSSGARYIIVTPEQFEI